LDHSAFPKWELREKFSISMSHFKNVPVGTLPSKTIGKNPTAKLAVTGHRPQDSVPAGSLENP
jgi:hypothetical protein